MSLILGRERALFDRHIVEAELNVDDFKLTEQLDPDGPIEGYFPTGTVTVTYTPTGVARSYGAGGGFDLVGQI